MKFDSIDGWHLCVVGDLKTPSNYRLSNGSYLSPELQAQAYPELSQAIGWNSIQRRNLGFLWALEVGAEIIATVDDDNIPLDSWGDCVLGSASVPATMFSGASVFDPITVAGYPHLWHRGFPIQLLNSRGYTANRTVSEFAIQAGFWNGDPDIDAICRMEHQPDCTFSDAYFPFTFDGFSPFNSQNTMLTRSALKHYCMIPHIGRMDDIWGGYYLQALGFRTVYTKATVIQRRNAHNLTTDFDREVIGYLNTESLVRALQDDPNAIHKFLPALSSRAFLLYLDAASKL